MNNHIFIEGLQGSGKTTLLRTLSQKYPEYKAYYEGDISPVELAWCSYMTKSQYEEALQKYPHVEQEIRQFTKQEGERYIVAYTRILAEQREFYEWMEQFEIYNARVSFTTFHDSIMKRYEALEPGKNIFECSFFQNSMESMMLYYQMEEQEIVDFYKEAYEILRPKGFQMFYLKSDNIRENILQIKRERTDENGVELWYPLMMKYLQESPYGKAHGYRDLEDMISHFERRCKIEERIIEEVLKEDCTILRAKKYKPEELESKMEERSMKIETERLIITEFDLSMAEAVHKNSLDEDNRRFVPDEVFETVEEAKETIEFLMNCYQTGDGPLVYPIVLKSGENIGYVQLVPLEEGYEIGYHIGAGYTKKGYATEAVKAFLQYIMKEKNLTEITGICLSENIASKKVMEKCGFCKEFEGKGQYQGQEQDIAKYIAYRA